MSTQQTQQGCDVCNKSGLSLLLLRPSPIATHSDLQAPGSANAVADAALVNPLIPSGLTESRPVLRLLREGFVHMYVPSKDLWRTWRVTDRADVLEQRHPLFASPSVDASCCRKGHNSSGFKLIHIPQAHELMGQSIWLAFSANLWSDTLKGRNKANPQAMVEVKLGSAAAPAFKPDAQSLKRQLLECNVSQWRLPRTDDSLQPQFPFNSLSRDEEVQHLAQTLQRAAAVHPKTLGHEVAVVLPDPVGYAAELNALRLIAEKRGLQLSAEDQHKLQSHFVLKGLVDNVADMRAMDTYAPVIPKREFDRITRNRPAYKGRWVSLDGRVTVESDGSTPLAVRDDEKGRYWMAGREEMVAQKLPEFQAKAKQEIEKGYDPTASEAWVKALEAKTRKALEPFERQWLTGRDHSAVAQYFAVHFDDADPNRPSSVQPHSAGATYIRETSLIDGPPPKTSVQLLDAYMAAYDKKPDDPYAFVVRVMVANQKELFIELNKQLTGDPNGDGMRDKSVDFIKGLLDIKGEHFRVKYSWLTEATMAFAMYPMSNLAAATTTFMALEGADALKSRPKVAALAVNAAAWFGGMDTALKSAMGQRVVRPVLASFWVERGVVNQAIFGPKGTVRGWTGARPGGRQRVTVLTDTERLSKGPADVQALLSGADGAEVARGKNAGAALAARASDAIVLNVATGLTPQQGAALFAHQVEEARKIGSTIRAAIPQGAKAMTMSIDGRLALASVIVQTIGIINGMQAVDKAEADLNVATDANREDKEKALLNAKLGYMDSVGGLVAGSLDSMRVAGEAMNLQRGVAAGGVALSSIYALKFGAQVAGVFGGALNAYVSYLKYDDAKEKGLWFVSVLHFTSALAFGGTGAASLVGASLTTAQFLVERQIGNVAVQQAAKRFVATRVAGIALGTAVPVVGWVLLGAGVVVSVGAALLEPTRLEAWARQTPFGKGPDGQKFKTREEQEKALHEALGVAVKAKAQEAQVA